MLDQVKKAVRLLRAGELVAFPTETVYGLGADASNEIAIKKIFELKNRPSNHPLIVHIESLEYLDYWAKDIPEAAFDLAKVFWPGPLSIILKRSDNTPLAVTGQQDTVALRVPGHPISLELLREFKGGIAAPSANKFGKISPTTAEHVREEFGETVKLVLDGGPSLVGLESTIIDLSGSRAQILRPGGIDIAKLATVLGFRPKILNSGETKVRASGTLSKHYAPKTKTKLVSSQEIENLFRHSDKRIGILSRQRIPKSFQGIAIVLDDSPKEYARAMYAALRQLDSSNLNYIYIEDVSNDADWLAIKDRLSRAAQ